MYRLSLSLCVFLLLCVCVSSSSLTFSVSESEQSYLNSLHHPSHVHRARQLETLFIQLDENEDGVIDQKEIEQLSAQGKITETEKILMEAFDTDESGDLSQTEFLLAPHTLEMIEMDTQVDEQEESDSDDAPLTTEMHAAESAFEGAEEESPAPRRLKSRIGSDSALLETSSTDAPPSLFKADKKSKKSAGGRRGNQPLPVSMFGVPSVADEECVLCQYLVQRISGTIADRLENPPAAGAAASAAGGAGLDGSSQAAQQALKVKQTNSQLQKKPGGRGIVRVVAEDIINSVCATDRMPLLFNPYCSGFIEPNTINAIRKGIFFNIPTVEVCAQAALCRDDSYINTNAAVHSTKTSMFLNGQRGICGMLGGARDRMDAREGSIINAICEAHGAVFNMGNRYPD